jgi:hypothetical protein
MLLLVLMVKRRVRKGPIGIGDERLCLALVAE